MREILFRGKTRHGKWVYGWFCGKTLNHMMDGTEECSQIIHSDTLYWHVVEPETVGQYTGLTDKNGKKIFEGDILEFRRGRTHIVKFEDGAFIFTCTAIPIRYADKFEVIGNIHDNPELLEVAP